MKYISFLFVTLLLVNLLPVTTSAQEVSKDELEEVLIIQLHQQISDAIKEAYDVSIVQFETPEILSIEKEYMPESSEELKPGTTYQLAIKVKVVNVKDSSSNAIIMFSNDNEKGEFRVSGVKKE